jgi:hypothetical protein
MLQHNQYLQILLSLNCFAAAKEAIEVGVFDKTSSAHIPLPGRKEPRTPVLEG